MPSGAYNTFLKNYEQVNKLKTAYEEELHKNPKRGKRSLDHYTRAAIMFLCSSFEVYFEDVLKESCIILSKSCSHTNDLPKQVRKTISKHVKGSNNELEPCIFANNWKEYYINLVDSGIKALNTPKMHNIKGYVSKYLGLNDIFDDTSYPLAGIDDIIHFLRREMLDFTAFPVFFVTNLLLVQRKKYYFNRATVSRNCSIVL